MCQEQQKKYLHKIRDRAFEVVPLFPFFQKTDESMKDLANLFFEMSWTFPYDAKLKIAVPFLRRKEVPF